MDLFSLRSTYFIFLTILGLTASGCGEGVQAEQDADSVTEALFDVVENRHNSARYRGHDGLQLDLDLKFNGKQRIDGRIIATTNENWIELRRKDGSILLYDGEQSYVAPDVAIYPKARFDLFTWHYFAVLPHKLRDPGTIREGLGVRDLNSEMTDLLAVKLTFEPGTGDSPDDWYTLYFDSTALLRASGYIVTAFKDKAEAEADPHAIVYSDYVLVDSVPFASRWDFFRYTDSAGLGEQLGTAELSNIKFLDSAEIDFRLPESRVITP